MLDRQTIETLCSELDRESVEEMVQMFLDDLDGHVAECARLLTAGEMANLEREAHSLKGSAASLGTTGLMEAASVTEEAAANSDAARASTGVEQMRDAAVATRPVLEKWLAGGAG
jgi:HPt (histidine-containing phosphotransfer) domain-containing protein